MLKQLHLAMLICISTFILSCSNEVEDKNTSKNTSTFSLSEVKEVSTRSYSDDELWPELKNKNVTDLKVCIVDTVYKEKVDGARFKLTINDKTTNVVSDVHGCITWQEYIDFDYTADESYILFSGKIEGTDNFKGIQEVKIAINPWSGSIVDLNQGGTVGKINTLNIVSKRKTHQNQINFKTALIDIKEISFIQDYSTNIRLEAIIQPYLLRKNIDGTAADPEFFTNGKFELDFLLIQKEYGTGKKTILAETSGTNQIDENGMLVNEISLEVKEQVTPGSVIELAIRLKPVDVAHRVGTRFNSLVLDDLQGKKKYVVNPTSYGYSQIKARSEFDDASNETEVNHGFVISNVKGTYKINDGVANGNNHNNISERRASVTIKLVDTLLHKGTNGEFEFSLYDTVENTVVGRTFIEKTDPNLNSGLITRDINFRFDDNFEYDYRKFILKVKGVSGIYAGITQEREVFINPRSSKTFLLDSKYSELPSVGEDIAAKIHFNKYNFEFKGNNNSKMYKLNRNLDLLGYRKVEVFVRPKLKLTHNYDSDLDPKLPDGKYKVKMLILTPRKPLLQNYDRNIDLKDFYVLTGAELNDVGPDDGLLTAKLDFPHLFEEKNLLAFKNISVLLIEPMDKNSKIKGSYHIGEIEFFRKKANVVSLYDSRLDDTKTLKLKQGNEEVAKYMSSHLEKLKNKLQKDIDIIDPFVAFKRDVLANNSFEEVPTIDHINYKIKYEKAFMNISDNANLFLSRNPELKLKKSQIVDLFYSGDFSGIVGEELCKLYYDPNQESSFQKYVSRKESLYRTEIKKGYEYEKCRDNPAEHLHMKELKFVDKITMQPGELVDLTGDPTIKTDKLKLSRSEAFFSSKGHLFAQIQGERTVSHIGIGNHTSLDFMGKLGKGPLAVFSAIGPDISVGKDYYKMSQKTDMESNQRRIINQSGLQFHVPIFGVSFKAMIKKCFLIAPKYVKTQIHQKFIDDSTSPLTDWFTNTDTRSIVTSPVRNLVCREFPVEEELTEKYYFVRLADTDNFGMTDSAMAKNTVGTVIRGEKAFEEFRSLDLKNDKLILFQSKNIMDKVKKHYEEAKIRGEDPDGDIYMADDEDHEVIRRYKYFMEYDGKDIQYKDRIGIGYPGLME